MSPKRLGELAEAQFIVAATARGFTVSKTFGDSARYDLVVEFRGRLFRVQVKSTASRDGSRYSIGNATGLRRRTYDKSDTDFIAAYVFPEDAWYIIPVEALSGRPQRLHLYPHRPNAGTLERFRNAWHLLCVPANSSSSAKPARSAKTSPAAKRPNAAVRSCRILELLTALRCQEGTRVVG